ncbi:MAG: hypothetical protein JSV66_00760 [Trueperaceae bacterium]|nr:MAG: hypothetical protein JSV66_00760 [Trueperaceae bacterium]
MIRTLVADEVVWFLSRAYAYLGHGDPWHFASRAVKRLRDLQREASRCYVYSVGDSVPVAGVYVIAPDHDEDEHSLRLYHLWYEESPQHLSTLLTEVLARHAHEAAYAPLRNERSSTVDHLHELLAGFGFELGDYRDLIFELSEVPPLGTPLVLEAWNLASDDEFRSLFEAAEAKRVSDAYWSWLKRWRGPFSPDLWFVARETLDQSAVGFALCGSKRPGVDGSYYLTTVGVRKEFRETSEMLRRLIVSVLLELSAQSPMGRIETTLSTKDPKLIDILHSLGFEVTDRYRMFVKEPA